MRQSTMPYLSSNGRGLVVLWPKQMSRPLFESYQFIPRTALLGMKWQNLYHFNPKHLYHCIRLSKEAKSDMATWLTFLDRFNGKTFSLDDKWETSSSLKLFTDAASSKGYGVIFGKHWFCGAWPASWTSLNIAF